MDRAEPGRGPSTRAATRARAGRAPRGPGDGMSVASTWKAFGLALLPVVSPLLLGAGVALADTPPSRWERTEDPDKADAWDLHVSVSREMSIAGLSTTNGPDSERIRERVRAILKDALKAPNPESFLLYDLGEVDSRLDHFGEVIEVLEPALARAGDDDPATERAWNAIAIAYAKTDDSHKEIHAYDRLLALTVDELERARILSNRAEAEMRLGHLEAAVEGYKDALAVSEANTGSSSLFFDSVLAHWGLTVALDRSGDVTGSEREASLTVGQGGLEAIRRKVVFFVPDYELFYYVGLGTMARAREAAGLREAAVIWSASEAAWTAYVTGALKAESACERAHACEGPDAECERKRKLACPGDLWLSLATAHLAHAQKERVKAEKRAGIRVPPRLGAEIRID
jgi:tetratricopeptide (TPR) repeat protein